MATDKQNSNNKNARPRKQSSRSRDVVRGVVQGRSFLSFDFFKRNSIYIVAATVMMLMYISNKYVYQMSMKQTMDLEVALGNARTDFVNASAKYNSMIRESQMKALVDTLHIDLTSPDQPPYQLN